MKGLMLDANGIDVFPLNTFRYEPVTPQADNETLAEQGKRVIVYHRLNGPRGMGCYTLEIRIAPKGMLMAGYVIGLIKE